MANKPILVALGAATKLNLAELQQQSSPTYAPNVFPTKELRGLQSPLSPAGRGMPRFLKQTSPTYRKNVFPVLPILGPQAPLVLRAAPRKIRLLQAQAFPSYGAGDVTTAITGQPATFAAGNLQDADSERLSGQAAAFSSGTVHNAVSQHLVGQAAAFSAGSIHAAPSVSLTGVAATASAGSLKGSITVALTGRPVTVVAGSLALGVGKPLSGTQILSSAGTVGYIVSGNVTAALTGTQVTMMCGNLAFTTDHSVPTDNSLIWNVGGLAHGPNVIYGPTTYPSYYPISPYNI